MASGVVKKQKTPKAFADDRVFWENIVRKGLKSIWGDNDLNPKKVANHIGIKSRTITNIRTGHRKISAADLFIFAKQLGMSPTDLINEIMNRNRHEIERRINKG